MLMQDARYSNGNYVEISDSKENTKLELKYLGVRTRDEYKHAQNVWNHSV